MLYINTELGNEKASALGYSDYKKVKEDISKIDWDKEVGRVNERYKKSQKNTKGFQRAMIWGMAIHSAMDIFSHSTYVNGSPILHTKDMQDADRVKYLEERYKDASVVAKQIMKAYISKRELTVNDLILPYKAITYKIKNLYEYVLEASEESVAKKVQSYSYSGSSK